ncbi:MAG: JAB domain-containing protein [Candidatus Wallbacteria bacterium]|nr:JAB domain-containing protein [Candidatus Wallbacteria bacterium]
MSNSFRLVLPLVSKAWVQGYWRTLASGERVWVGPHRDKRPEERDETQGSLFGGVPPEEEKPRPKEPPAPKAEAKTDNPVRRVVQPKHPGEKVAAELIAAHAGAKAEHGGPTASAYREAMASTHLNGVNRTKYSREELYDALEVLDAKLREERMQAATSRLDRAKVRRVAEARLAGSAGGDRSKAIGDLRSSAEVQLKHDDTDRAALFLAAAEYLEQGGKAPAHHSARTLRVVKAHVRGHFRTLPTGQRVYVKPHDDGRHSGSVEQDAGQLSLFAQPPAEPPPAIPPVELVLPVASMTPSAEPDPQPPLTLRKRGSFAVKDVAIRNSKDAAELLDFLRDENREKFYAVALDEQGRALHAAMISAGTLNASLVGVREAFQPALVAGAKRVIFAHNHPSGDPTPSPEDIAVTMKLRAAGRDLGVEVADSIVLGDGGQHASIRELAMPDLAGYDASSGSVAPGEVAEVETVRAQRPKGDGPKLITSAAVAEYARRSMTFAPGTWGVLSIGTKGRLEQLSFVSDPMTSGTGLRDVLRAAVVTSAASIIVVKPAYTGSQASQQALAATEMAAALQAAANVSGIPVSDVVSLAREGSGYTSYRAAHVVKGVVLLVKSIRHDPTNEHVKTSRGADGRALHWYQTRDRHYYSSSEAPVKDAGAGCKAGKKQESEDSALLEHHITDSTSGLSFRVRCSPEEAKRLGKSARQVGPHR